MPLSTKKEAILNRVRDTAWYNRAGPSSGNICTETTMPLRKCHANIVKPAPQTNIDLTLGSSFVHEAHQVQRMHAMNNAIMHNSISLA